ncbi:30S ribosomal protein S15 [Candidatus Micrarchaeota archaeon]|nr:30S ribosomal protein S15 [Candidatus Micrarchaeota archaeon]
MARLHSKKRGKSGTKRAKSTVAPKWSSAKKAEILEMITKLSKEGMSASKIGLLLRDEYGVPNSRALLGKRLVSVLKSENAAPQYPEDLLNLIKRALRVRGHLKASKKDTHNKVKLSHIEAKIQRLVKYYSSKGMLPKAWKYNPEQAALIVK